MKRIIQLEKDYWLIAEENMSETKANHTLIANSPGIREIKKSLDKKKLGLTCQTSTSWFSLEPISKNKECGLINFELKLHKESLSF